MFFLIFLAAAVILAIPTWGISLIVFLVVKNWFDNRAMSSLLGACVTAMRTEVSEERYHINQAAIRKVFRRFAAGPFEVKLIGNGAATLYWGLLRHPLINNNQIFSARFSYTPRNGWSNTVFIKSGEGRDPDVLGTADLESVAAGLANAFNRSTSADDHTDERQPQTDDEIHQMLVALADGYNNSRAFTKISYGRMCKFATSAKFEIEFLEENDAMQFDFSEGQFTYSVRVSNLAVEGMPGVMIRSLLIGFVEDEDENAAL